MTQGTPAEIFCGYAASDAPIFQALKAQLAPMCQEGLVTLWHEGSVLGGDEREAMVTARLQSAIIILLLVSADLLSEQQERLIAPALARHARGEARVVPLLIRSADWTRSALGALSPLPSSEPITLWPNQDQAFTAVARGLRDVVCLWHQLPAALAAAMPSSADAQDLIFNLGLPTGLAAGPEGLPLWRKVVQQIAASGQTVTVFDLTARALQRHPNSAELLALRDALPQESVPGGRTLGQATQGGLQGDVAAVLRRLAEDLHDPFIRQGAAWLARGKYVAFLAPSGFGASRCLRAFSTVAAPKATSSPTD